MPRELDSRGIIILECGEKEAALNFDRVSTGSRTDRASKTLALKSVPGAVATG